MQVRDEAPPSRRDFGPEGDGAAAPPCLLFDWIDEGAGDEAATRGNLDSFRRHRFLPRYLRDDVGAEPGDATV